MSSNEGFPGSQFDPHPDIEYLIMSCTHERRSGCACGKNWSCLDCGYGECAIPCECPIMFTYSINGIPQGEVQPA